MSDDKPKLHIDDDWKKQAQAEKQRLAEQEKHKQQAQQGQSPSQGASASAKASAAENRQLPPATFESLVSTFATQAMISMGMIEHPEAHKMINLELAKFNIDMLGVIEEKTKGNLTENEKKLLSQTLHQLRMAFVQVSTAQAGPIGA